MDSPNFQTSEPPEMRDHGETHEGVSGSHSRKLWKIIIPACIVLAIPLVVGVYLWPAPPREKIVAQVFSYEILREPRSSTVTLSVTNKQGKQTIIVRLYPVIFGKKNSPIYSRSIESTIDDISLPLILQPGEVRILQIHYSIAKKELDEYADILQDSSHIMVFQNGAPPGQLEGNLGLGWKVVDADGENYTNTARLAYYVLTPTPEGFADPTALTRSWILTEKAFELCTNEGIVKP